MLKIITNIGFIAEFKKTKTEIGINSMVSNSEVTNQISSSKGKN